MLCLFAWAALGVLSTFTYGKSLNFTWGCHDFSDTAHDVLGWYVAHTMMILMGLGSLAGLIKDQSVRHTMVFVCLGEVLREQIELAVWNNSYGTAMLAFNTTVFAIELIWTWGKLK